VYVTWRRTSFRWRWQARQNVRHDAKLTGWRVDIQKSGETVTFEQQRETAIAELGRGPEP
jgi:hypothetical protein